MRQKSSQVPSLIPAVVSSHGTLIIVGKSGTHFVPDVVDAFLRILGNGGIR